MDRVLVCRNCGEAYYEDESAGYCPACCTYNSAISDKIAITKNYICYECGCEWKEEETCNCKECGSTNIDEI